MDPGHAAGPAGSSGPPCRAGWVGRVRDPSAPARWCKLSVFCGASQKPLWVLTQANASSLRSPFSEPATKCLDKKVALALRDWDFLQWVTSHPQGYLLNNFYRLHQVEKQLPCSCFMLFGVWLVVGFFHSFFFFLNAWHLEILLPCKQGALLPCEMQPRLVHVLHHLHCIPALTSFGKLLVTMGFFVRRVCGFGGNICEQWFVLVGWRTRCHERGPLSWCQHGVLVVFLTQMLRG